MVQNTENLLQRLQQHGVDFVIIGGMCGVLHGASMVTFDLDVCCDFNRDNLYRLHAAMKDLHPYHRLAANKLPFELTDELCTRLKNVYLKTDLGILDCLGEVTGVGNYQKVLERSVVHKGSQGEYRILSIEALIDAKQAIGRDRDLAMIKLLRGIKERISKTE